MTADSCFATAETIKPTVPAGRPALRRSLFAVLLVVSFLAVAAVCSSAAFAAAPANDDFANAEVLTGPSDSSTGTVAEATEEPDEPDHYFGFTDSSVWYSWTAPTSGQFFVDVSGSFAVVAIYTGSDLATLTPVTVAFNSTAFTAVSGETYQIAVSKASGFAAGAFTINLDEAGSISGNVTDDSAGALEGICVGALDADRSQVAASTTDLNGDYSLSLPPGDFKVEFRNCGSSNIVPEYYNDKSSFASADPVTVVAGTDTPGKDAELAPGALISGTVTDTSPSPIEFLSVYVVDEGGDQSGFASTDVNGDYTVEGLPPGNYRVGFTVLVTPILSPNTTKTSPASLLPTRSPYPPALGCWESMPN